VHDVGGMRAPPALVELERQQRQQRVDRLKLACARVAGGSGEAGQVELDELGHEQEQAGVLAGDRPQPRPVLGAQPPRLGRHRRRGLGGRQPTHTGLGQELPDRRARQPRDGRRQRPADLLQRAALATQRHDQRPCAVLLGLRARPRPRGREQAQAPGAIVAHQRLHGRARVAEAPRASCADAPST